MKEEKRTRDVFVGAILPNNAFEVEATSLKGEDTFNMILA
jgi:hypothetical protein